MENIPDSVNGPYEYAYKKGEPIAIIKGFNSGTNYYADELIKYIGKLLN